MAYAVEMSASGPCGGTLLVVTSMMLMLMLLLLLMLLLMLVWSLVLLLLGWHQCSEEPCPGAASSLVLTRVWGVGATGWRHSGWLCGVWREREETKRQEQVGHYDRESSQS